MTKQELVKTLEENKIEFKEEKAYWNENIIRITTQITANDLKSKKLIKKLGFKCSYSARGFYSIYRICFEN